MLGLSRNKTITLFTFLLVITGSNVINNAIKSGKEMRDFSAYTIEAQEGRLPSLVTASGELQAKKSIDVNPHRQGIVEIMYVQEGDKVSKNQLIAKLESRDFKFRLEEQKANYENTKAAFERRKELFLKGGISKETYDEFSKSFLISKSKLDQIKVEGKELFITAPLQGRVTARHADPGTFVSPNTTRSNNESTFNQAIVEISQGIEVIAKVPESDIGRIQIGQESNIRIEAFPDELYKALVSEIAPRAIKSNNVTSFEVKLSLVNPPPKLRIGMTSDIEFETGKSGLRTLVPTVAIVTEEGEAGVLVVGKNKEVLFQKVELGSSNGNQTSIIKGIKPGEKIFIDIPPWSKRKRK